MASAQQSKLCAPRCCRRATHNPIPESCELSFFTTVYLVLLTATTLGLGDIFPADDVARYGKAGCPLCGVWAVVLPLPCQRNQARMAPTGWRVLECPGHTSPLGLDTHSHTHTLHSHTRAHCAAP